eukprot:SAG11_NODE_36122_length_263_cov_0.634146_1_plen_45_part_10
MTRQSGETQTELTSEPSELAAQIPITGQLKKLDQDAQRASRSAAP